MLGILFHAQSVEVIKQVIIIIIIMYLSQTTVGAFISTSKHREGKNNTTVMGQYHCTACSIAPSRGVITHWNLTMLNLVKGLFNCWKWKFAKLVHTGPKPNFFHWLCILIVLMVAPQQSLKLWKLIINQPKVLWLSPKCSPNWAELYSPSLCYSQKL